MELTKRIKKFQKVIFSARNEDLNKFTAQVRDKTFDQVYTEYNRMANKAGTMMRSYTLEAAKASLSKEHLMREISYGKKRLEEAELKAILHDSDHFDPEEVDNLISDHLKDTEGLKELVSAETEARFGSKEREQQIKDLDGRILEKRWEAYQYSSKMKSLKKSYDAGELEEQDYKEESSSIRQNFEKEQESVENIIKGVENDLSEHTEEQNEFLESYKFRLETIETKIENNKEDIKGIPQRLERIISECREDRDEKEKMYKEAVADCDETIIAYKEYSAYRKDQKEAYEKYKDNIDNEMLFSGIREAAGQYESIFSNAMKEGHKNSAEYDEIYTRLKKVMDLKGTDPVKLMDRRIEKLYNAATEYLVQKEKQWRLFPSNQRTFRLNYARSIQSFCIEQRKMLDENGIDADSEKKIFIEKAGQMYNKKPLTEKEFLNKDFFKKYSYELDGKPAKKEEKAEMDIAPLLSESNNDLDMNEAGINERRTVLKEESLLM